MRIVSSSKDNRQFSTDLLKIGNGVNDFIALNNICVLVKNVEELTEKVYPVISNISTKTLNLLQERAILSPTNEQIDEKKILLFQNLIFHRKPITQLTQSWIERRQYIIQLNSLTPPGIPQHKLILKVGSPIISSSTADEGHSAG